MAIDTRAKRASVQAYTLGLMRPPPTGNGTAADRATVAWVYSGHTYSAAVGVGEIYGFNNLIEWFELR